MSRESLVELWIADDVLTNHRPHVGAVGDGLEGLKFTIIIFVIVFTKGNELPFHLLLFICKSADNVPMFDGCHWKIEYVHVIVVQHIDAIFYIPWFRSIGDKLKIGVSAFF